MNKTTKNFLKAIHSSKQISTVRLVHKLIYDPESGKLLDTTVDDLDHSNWIEITLEQHNQQLHLHPSYSIVNGKLNRITKHINNQETPNRKPLRIDCHGNIATDPYNMLLISNVGLKRWTYD